MKKVKGHTTEEDVHKGVVKAEDKEGNDAADALAVAGAFENDLKTVSKRLRVQLDATLAVQRMMVSILQLRACKRAEQAHQKEALTDSEDVTDSYSSTSSSEGSCMQLQ